MFTLFRHDFSVTWYTLLSVDLSPAQYSVWTTLLVLSWDSTLIDVEQSLPLTNAVFSSSNDEEILCAYACLTFISCLWRLGIKGGYHCCCLSGGVLHAADVPCQAMWFHLFLSSYVNVILWETSMLLPYLCWMESFKHFINHTSCPGEVSSSFLSILFEVKACILRTGEEEDWTNSLWWLWPFS